MTGPLLALLCFALLLACAAVERRRVERVELEAWLESARPSALGQPHLVAGRAVPSVAALGAAMDRFGRAAAAAALAQERFRVAWREAEARDGEATVRFLDG